MQVMSTDSTYTTADLYYQCADIELSADAPETPTAECSAIGGPDAGGEPGDGDGGCRVAGGGSLLLAGLALTLTALFRRR
jgi:hypothetical protein